MKFTLSTRLNSGNLTAMKKIILILCFLLLGGCHTSNVLSDYRFQTQTVPPYVVASWFKIEKPTDMLYVYIEGDGNAFNVKGQPTDNPTPKDTFVRQLAANDPRPNVAYLGRPCQYLQAGACQQTDWTTGRFSEKIVTSMERSVLNLMKKAQTKKVVLIGFSGGAQIAGLIAVRHPKSIHKVITIAGVLDHHLWTQHHQLMPLEHSLNLVTQKHIFKTIPQHHFVGEKDDVVPASLVQDFVEDSQQITIVKRATHHKGFERVAKDIYQQGK